MGAVLKYAKQHGYKSVIARGKWNGYAVYEMVLSESETLYVGIPQYILDDGTELRISDADEAFEILDKLTEIEVDGK